MTSARHVYSAFGLVVRSNGPLPGLAVAGGEARGRPLEVRFAEPPAGPQRPPDHAPAAEVGLERVWRLEGGERLLHYVDPSDGAGWSMRVTAEAIEVAHHHRFAPAQMAPVISTSGLAVALQLNGVPLLHAAAVAVEGRAVLLLAPSGTGKSTTAAAFVAGGYPLLSDDVSALTVDGEGFLVQSGPARLRVLPATARAVGWDPSRLERVFDTELMSDKRAVELSAAAGTYRGGAAPLAAIYVLGRRGEAVGVGALTPREALPVLGANVFRRSALDRAQLAALLGPLARVACTVPIRRVVAVNDLARVGELAEAIAADVSSLRRPAPAR